MVSKDLSFKKHIAINFRDSNIIYNIKTRYDVAEGIFDQKLELYNLKVTVIACLKDSTFEVIHLLQ